MHGVYVLQSKKDGDLYVGYSHDIKRRLEEHNKGLVSATSRRRPLKVIYCELFTHRKDAMRRELYLKTGWGRKYLSKVLQEALKNRQKFWRV